MSARKQRREVLAYAKRLGLAGARIVNGGKHPLLCGITPSGKRIRMTFAGTPGDWRTRKNNESALRRAVLA